MFEIRQDMTTGASLNRPRESIDLFISKYFLCGRWPYGLFNQNTNTDVEKLFSRYFCYSIGSINVLFIVGVNSFRNKNGIDYFWSEME